MSLTIPPEGNYSDVEQDWIDLEPANLLPETQDSLWGQMRTIFAWYLQENVVDVLNDWWNQLDPDYSKDVFLARYEQMLGLPASSASKSPEQRRAFVKVRLVRGALTREQRKQIIDLFFAAIIGPSLTFTPDGIAFSAGGAPFYSGLFDLTGAYDIVESIEDYSFTIEIAIGIGEGTVIHDLDIDGITRELNRIVPSGISFTIS